MLRRKERRHNQFLNQCQEAALACICAFSMGDRSVKRNSSCRLLGMRMVRSAALQSARNLLSLRHTAQNYAWSVEVAVSWQRGPAPLLYIPSIAQSGSNPMCSGHSCHSRAAG